MTSSRPDHSLVIYILLTSLCFGSGCASIDRSQSIKTQDKGADRESISIRTASLDRLDGFLVIYRDQELGTVWLELPAPDESGVCLEFLLNHGLRRGLGSNPIGLDRGQLRGGSVIQVRRVGKRVLFERPNLSYRAPRGTVAEQRAARESFATSVLWGTDAAVVDTDGRSLIDLKGFLVRDGHSVVSTLKDTGQGVFRLDPQRSAVELSEVLAFPDNVELEASLTFSGNSPGRYVRNTVPDPTSITLVQHLSLIRLPDDQYRPRLFDPRLGTFSVGYLDYSAPLSSSLDVRFATRHRLSSGKPLIYYVDSGAPEPIRTALVEGARWWERAFREAGFPGVFQVEVLPEDVHPLDVRYNVIQWVHRSTRGWSYGASITDPRTGEIIKGHVSLGSLRVRQDRLLFEGLAGVARTGTGEPADPIQLALARIRQLSAHEVGHTLGLAHNFAASTQNRASVMDYPAPDVRLGENGELDFSRAYGVGVGEWDRHVIRWLYSVAPTEAGEQQMLERMVTEGISRGFIYLTDADARDPGACDPRGSLWDNGEDAVEGLRVAIAVRSKALAQFGDGNLHVGQPRTRLAEVFIPVYFHHRYQLEAATKTIGGVEYEHSLLGDRGLLPRPIARDRQQAALEVLLSTFEPEFLEVPASIVQRLVPRAPGSPQNRELLDSNSAPVFDSLGAAATLADLTVQGLLVPERLARTVDTEGVSLEEVLESLESYVSKAIVDSHEESELIRVVARVIVEAMMNRAATSGGSPTVREAIDASLEEVLAEARNTPVQSSRGSAFASNLIRDLERHLVRAPSERLGRTPAAAPPPGSPIGCGCE